MASCFPDQFFLLLAKADLKIGLFCYTVARYKKWPQVNQDSLPQYHREENIVVSNILSEVELQISICYGLSFSDLYLPPSNDPPYIGMPWYTASDFQRFGKCSINETST